MNKKEKAKKEIAKITLIQQGVNFELKIQFYDKKFSEFIENLASNNGLNTANNNGFYLKTDTIELFPKNILFERVISACMAHYCYNDFERIYSVDNYLNAAIFRIKQKNNAILFKARDYFTSEERDDIITDLTSAIQLMYRIYKKKEVEEKKVLEET